MAHCLDQISINDFAGYPNTSYSLTSQIRVVKNNCPVPANPDQWGSGATYNKTYYSAYSLLHASVLADEDKDAFLAASQAAINASGTCLIDNNLRVYVETNILSPESTDYWQIYAVTSRTNPFNGSEVDLSGQVKDLLPGRQADWQRFSVPFTHYDGFILFRIRFRSYGGFSTNAVVGRRIYTPSGTSHRGLGFAATWGTQKGSWVTRDIIIPFNSVKYEVIVSNHNLVEERSVKFEILTGLPG